MKSKGNCQEINTQRLCLRRFQEEDFDAYAGLVADPEIGKWFPQGRGFSLEEAKKTFTTIQEHWIRRGFGIWAIVHKTNQSLIGRCGLNWIDETSEVEIDFLLAKKFWGQGYTTEAAKVSVRYGFTALRLDRIIGLTKINNIAARRVMEKSGLRYIKNVQYWGILCAYYAISKSDYEHKE